MHIASNVRLKFYRGNGIYEPFDKLPKNNLSLILGSIVAMDKLSKHGIACNNHALFCWCTFLGMRDWALQSKWNIWTSTWHSMLSIVLRCHPRMHRNLSPLMYTISHKVCIAHSFSFKMGHCMLQCQSQQPNYGTWAVLHQRSSSRKLQIAILVVPYAY